MNKLEVKDLRFSYDKKENIEIIKNLSFSLADGASIAILGESGCGKTTLLKLIMGLITGEGKIFLNGIDAFNISVKNRNLSYVSQSFTMYPNYNVYNNIAMPLKAAKIDYDEIDRRVKEIADSFNISFLLTRKSKELSLGQQQIVSIAHALVKNADLYLFDEPFANIDIKNKIILRKMLNDYRKKYHKTFLIVTHDINDAISLADEVIVMDNGTFIQRGNPRDVYKNPKNDLVKKIVSFGGEKSEILL